MKKQLLFLIFLGFLVLPIVALGQWNNSGYGSGGGDLNGTLQSIVTTFVTVAGAVVVIGWIIAGLLYLTAAGAPDKLSTAHKAIFACAVGTAVVILAVSAKSIIESAIGGGSGSSWF